MVLVYRKCNVMCFEGACFALCGAEDWPAYVLFLIYWDDALYGYLASKVTQPI